MERFGSWEGTKNRGEMGVYMKRTKNVGVSLSRVQKWRSLEEIRYVGFLKKEKRECCRKKNSAALPFRPYRGMRKEIMWKNRRKFCRLGAAKLAPEENPAQNVETLLFSEVTRSFFQTHVF